MTWSRKAKSIEWQLSEVVRRGATLAEESYRSRQSEKMLSYFTWKWEIADVMGGISQLVDSLSKAEESGGFDLVAGVLKRVGRHPRESADHGSRLVLVTMPCPKYDFDVGALKAAEGKSTLSIIGLERYAGFSFACALPPITFSAELQPDVIFGVSWRAKRLFEAIHQDQARAGTLYRAR